MIATSARRLSSLASKFSAVPFSKSAYRNPGNPHGRPDPRIELEQVVADSLASFVGFNVRVGRSEIGRAPNPGRQVCAVKVLTDAMTPEGGMALHGRIRKAASEWAESTAGPGWRCPVRVLAVLEVSDQPPVWGGEGDTRSLRREARVVGFTLESGPTTLIWDAAG